jgi:DNA-binding GntR family transcriptional regulator
MNEESPLPTKDPCLMGTLVRPARGQNADFVHARLRADILTLKIQPGEELDETILSSRYAVSRTPVREALIRLASDKLVVLSRNRRAMVQPLDLAGFPGYLEALDLLQRAVTRLAAQRRSDEDLTAIRTARTGYDHALSSSDSLASVEANLSFHDAVAKAAHSPHLADAYHRILMEGMRYMALSFSVHDPSDRGYEPHMRSVTEEHGAMVDAIASQDADRAEDLAHDHIGLFRKRIAAYLERDGTASVSVPGRNRRSRNAD